MRSVTIGSDRLLMACSTFTRSYRRLTWEFRVLALGLTAAPLAVECTAYAVKDTTIGGADA